MPLSPEEIPMATGHSSEVVRFEHVEKHKMLNHNSYATKKTVAQGMLDIALLTANASQLKYLLQVGTTHDFYYLMVSMISISIILQVGVGLAFLAIASMNINRQEEQKKANIMNNLITALIFIITVFNVLISAFGMKEDDDRLTAQSIEQRTGENL